MKRISLLIMVLAMLVSFAACDPAVQPSGSESVPGSALPDDAEITAEAAANEPSEAPTAAPTTDSTADSTELVEETPYETEVPSIIPHYELLEEALASLQETPFDKCAEKVMSAVPNSSEGPCYSYIANEKGEDEFESAPKDFSVDGSKIYVNDMWTAQDNMHSIFVYDMSTGSAARVDLGLGGGPAETASIIVVDGILYTLCGYEDLNTGKTFKTASCLSSAQNMAGNWFMTAYDGGLHLFLRSDPEDGDAQSSYIYTLDKQANAWGERETWNAMNKPFPSGAVNGVFSNGNCCFLLDCSSEAGAADRLCIALTDKDGGILAYTFVPYSTEELSATDSANALIAAPDGSIYYMACLKDETAVWKIDLN